MSKNLSARVDAIETTIAGYGVTMDAILAHLERLAPASSTPAPERVTAKRVTEPKPKPGRSVDAPRDALGRYLPETKRVTKPAKGSKRVTKPVATKPVKGSQRSSNVELAAWLRQRNLPAYGACWTAAKNGERRVARLHEIWRTDEIMREINGQVPGRLEAPGQYTS